MSNLDLTSVHNQIRILAQDFVHNLMQESVCNRQRNLVWASTWDVNWEIVRSLLRASVYEQS